MANSDIYDYINNISTKTYRKDEVIFSQGEYSNGKMYFLFEGELSATRNKNGKEIELGTLEPGSFFGEMALIKPLPRAATIKAKTIIAKVGIIDKESFLKLSKTSPGFLFGLLKTVIERLYGVEQQLEKLVNEKENRI